jgi:hypothetical protein
MKGRFSFSFATPRPLRSAGLVAILALAVGCGGGGSPTTPATPTPPPTPPPPSVVLQSGYPIAAGYLYAEFFSTDRTGTIDATIDYTFTTNQIVVWIARGSCTAELFMANQCNYTATSFAGSKPRRVSVTAAAAGTYTLIVGNGGPQDDSVSYQVVLTPTASASAAGPTAAMMALPKPYLMPLPRH